MSSNLGDLKQTFATVKFKKVVSEFFEIGNFFTAKFLPILITNHDVWGSI